MLNTGSALSHGNESLYNRYRSFLIANQGALNGGVKMRNKVAEELGKVPFSAPRGFFADAYWALYYTDLVKDRSTFSSEIHKKLPGDYRPEKYCYKCSEMGFHSKVFDFPWVTHCPIHEIKLVSKCIVCRNPWPSLRELRKRTCECCGVAIRFDDLVKTRLGKPRSLLEAVDVHHLIHEVLIPDVMPKICLEYESAFLPKAEGSLSIYTSPNMVDWFSLSVLNNFEKLPSRLFDYHALAKFDLHSVSKEPFCVDNLTLASCKANLRKSWHKGIGLAKKELKYAMQIQLGTAHKLGLCDDDSGRCILCSSWRAWSEIVKYEKYPSGYGCFPSNFALANSVQRILGRVNLSVAVNISSHNDTLWSPIIPPKNLQSRLVYLDAIELFIRIYIINISIRVLIRKNARITITQIVDYLPESVRNTNRYLIPRKICKVDRHWELVWPKLNLRATLTDPEFYWCH